MVETGILSAPSFPVLNRLIYSAAAVKEENTNRSLGWRGKGRQGEHYGKNSFFIDSSKIIFKPLIFPLKSFLLFMDFGQNCW